MYIPKHYILEDEKQILEFINEYSFATIITTKDSKPVATHLPFLVKKVDDKIILSSHMSIQNPQWHYFADSEVMVIFQGPHSYISPGMYEKKQNVPTWNYLAVHVYGKVITEEINSFSLLEEMIIKFEKDYLQQWQSLSEDYKQNMVKGIFPFKIEVSDIQAKAKLSQNKSIKDIQNIIAKFSATNDENQNKMAELMNKLSIKE